MRYLRALIASVLVIGGLTTVAAAAGAGVNYSDNVQILPRANGSLDINGDNGNNSVELCFSEGGYAIVVRSNDGPGIATYVDSVTTDLRVNLKGGDDTFSIGERGCRDEFGGEIGALDDHNYFPRDVRINMGSGSDSVGVVDIEVGDDLTILTGSGADEVFALGVLVDDRFDVNTSSGDSYVYVIDSYAGKSSFRGGNNSDEFVFVDTYLGTAPRILTLSGDDVVVGIGIVAEGRVTANTGNGDDLFGWSLGFDPCEEDEDCCELEDEDCCELEDCCESEECCESEDCCGDAGCIEQLEEDGFYFNLILGGGDDEAHMDIELIPADRLQGSGGNDYLGFSSPEGARINGFEVFGEPDLELFEDFLP